MLERLNFDVERANERSALVLLALLDLAPTEDWSSAIDPLRRTVEILAFIRRHYGRDYAPNTRETIRRFTLHQFVEAGLLVQNPDRPDPPTNSPRWCYQIEPAALELVRGLRRQGFEKRLRQ